MDVRSIPAEKLTGFAGGIGQEVKLLLTAWQWVAWGSMGSRPGDSRLVVMVPDFLHYARLISTGRAKEIPQLPGSYVAVMKAGVRCVPTGMRNLGGIARGDFWAGAEALLAYDMGLLAGFSGEVVLHSNVADFAWVFEREEFLRRFKQTCGTRMLPGVACQQLEKGLSACARWNFTPHRIIYSSGFDLQPLDEMRDRAERLSFVECKWTADRTQWPMELLAECNLLHAGDAEEQGYLVSWQAALQIVKQVQR